MEIDNKLLSVADDLARKTVISRYNTTNEQIDKMVGMSKRNGNDNKIYTSLSNWRVFYYNRLLS